MVAAGSVDEVTVQKRRAKVGGRVVGMGSEVREREREEEEDEEEGRWEFLYSNVQIDAGIHSMGHLAFTQYTNQNASSRNAKLQNTKSNYRP